MSKAKYRCPNVACGCEELTGPICEKCGLDTRFLFVDQRVAPEEVALKLGTKGLAFYDRTGRLLYLCGHADWCPIQVAPDKYSRADLDIVLTKIRDACELSPAYYSREHVKLFLNYLHRVGPDTHGYPRVSHAGDKPQLVLDEGRLVWPEIDAERPNVIRFAGAGSTEPEALHYTGPPFTPELNGAFDEFLASVRVTDPIYRDTLFCWLAGAVCPTLYSPGQSPILLLCSRASGAGKSTVAHTLGRFLGGCHSVYWEDVRKLEDLNRCLLSTEFRALLVDNIRPPAGSSVFDDSKLAHFVTQEQITVKQLYRSRGAIQVPNRVAFLATANSPDFSPETLARCAVVELLPLDHAAADTWASNWAGRRLEVLADLFAQLQRNWDLGLPQLPRQPNRFVEWSLVVARATQRVPTLLPGNSMVRTPFERYARQFLEREGGAAPAVKLVDQIMRSNIGLAVVVRKQQDLSDGGVRRALVYCGGRIRTEDRGGMLWLVNSES